MDTDRSAKAPEQSKLWRNTVRVHTTQWQGQVVADYFAKKGFRVLTQDELFEWHREWNELNDIDASSTDTDSIPDDVDESRLDVPCAESLSQRKQSAISREYAELARSSLTMRQAHQLALTSRTVPFHEQKLDRRVELMKRISFFWMFVPHTFPFHFYCRQLAPPPEGGSSEYLDARGGARVPVVFMSHLSGQRHLVHKSRVAQNLFKYWGAEAWKFHPESVTVGRDKEGNWCSYKARHLARAGKWCIVKPVAGACGNGIELARFESHEHLARWLHRNFPTHRTVIVQKYLGKPFLLDGRKFDIRVYLNIIHPPQDETESHSPENRQERPAHNHFTWLPPMQGEGPTLLGRFAPGYVRVSASKYKPPKHSTTVATSSRGTHITNFHVQRDHPDYDPETDSVGDVEVRMSFDDFLSAVEDSGVSTKQQIMSRMNRILSDSVMATRHLLDSALGHFCLLGVDFLMDSKANLWLLEFTRGPALRNSPDWLASLHEQVLHELLDGVLDASAAKDPQSAFDALEQASVEQDKPRVWYSLTRLARLQGLSIGRAVETLLPSDDK